MAPNANEMQAAEMFAMFNDCGLAPDMAKLSDTLQGMKDAPTNAMFGLCAIKDKKTGHVTNHLCYANEEWEELCGLQHGSVNNGECQNKEIKGALTGVPRTGADGVICKKMADPLDTNDFDDVSSTQASDSDDSSDNESVKKNFGLNGPLNKTKLITMQKIKGHKSVAGDARSLDAIMRDVTDKSRPKVEFTIQKKGKEFNVAVKAVRVCRGDCAELSVCVAMPA